MRPEKQLLLKVYIILGEHFFGMTCAFSEGLTAGKFYPLSEMSSSYSVFLSLSP